MKTFFFFLFFFLEKQKKKQLKTEFQIEVTLTATCMTITGNPTPCGFSSQAQLCPELLQLSVPLQPSFTWFLLLFCLMCFRQNCKHGTKYCLCKHAPKSKEDNEISGVNVVAPAAQKKSDVGSWISFGVKKERKRKKSCEFLSQKRGSFTNHDECSLHYKQIFLLFLSWVLKRAFAS